MPASKRTAVGRKSKELWRHRIKNEYGLITSFCVDPISQNWMCLTSTNRYAILWDLRHVLCFQASKSKLLMHFTETFFFCLSVSVFAVCCWQRWRCSLSQTLLGMQKRAVWIPPNQSVSHYQISTKLNRHTVEKLIISVISNYAHSDACAVL